MSERKSRKSTKTTKTNPVEELDNEVTNEITDVVDKPKLTGKVRELHSVFKSCLDILRNDASHLIGDEALNELSHFLILKLAEPHILDGSIDIFNLDYYPNGVNVYGEKQFTEYLEYIKFSKFLEYVKNPEKEVNIKNVFDNFMWHEVLSCHPKFKDVFEDGKKSFIKSSTTIKKMIITLGDIDFTKYDHDILGEAYESIFVDAVFGAGGNKKSELGQFFTPPKVKNLLVELVNPSIKANGDIESVFDPACGTGGILNTVIKHYKDLAKKGKISRKKLQTQLIQNIYGIEIKEKIFNLCMSNMLVNTGEILPHVICADSIRKYHKIKVDNIIANPPFSVAIDYSTLLSSIGNMDLLNDYVPIKVGGKNSELLFLQMMIHCLNIGGKCATVMLDGQKMNGSSSGNDKVREYLVKSCDLHKVILCPSGTFTSTASKTCILFFTKKKERKDVLEINAKRGLKFKDGYSTPKVEFSEFNNDDCSLKVLGEVGINDIVKNGYSLSYADYASKKEHSYSGSVEMKPLGEVCIYPQGKKRTLDFAVLNGKYNFYNCSINESLKANEYDYENYGMIINAINGSGKCNIYYSCKYSITSNNITFTSINENAYSNKYIYYYLKLNIHVLEAKFVGSNQKKITKQELSNINLPIPPMKQQTAIVELLDTLTKNGLDLVAFTKYYEGHNIFNILLKNNFTAFNKLVSAYEIDLKLNEMIELQKTRQQQELYYVSETTKNVKTLGEVCNFWIGGTPSRNVKAYYENGTNLWVSVRELNGGYIYDSTEKITDDAVQNSSVKLCPVNTVLFSFKLSIGKTAIVGKPLYTNEAIAGINAKNSSILKNKFIYHYLSGTDFSKCGRGAIGGGSLNKKTLAEINLPVPTPEIQQQIITFCEQIQSRIDQIEADKLQNKESVISFLTALLESIDNTDDEHNEELAAESDVIHDADKIKKLDVDIETKGKLFSYLEKRKYDKLNKRIAKLS
jgi:type I restriction-modification system DNA methylase subunit